MEFTFPKLHPHELVLFFYPSPGLNWMNPKALTLTTARNRLLGRARGIGHVSVLLRGPTRTLATGMTQLHQNEGRSEVLFGGYGLGILLHNFAGRIENSEKLMKELESRSKKEGKLSYLRIALNAGALDRLFRYIDTYLEKGFDGHYGMRNRPLYGEGSGCSAFGASFLETAGLLREEFSREWTRSFNIPRDLIGGPVTGKRVSVLELFRRADRWALEDEPHEKGFFWDPDLMHEWATRVHAAPGDSAYRPEKWNATIGLGFDAKAHVPPTGEIFRSP